MLVIFFGNSLSDGKFVPKLVYLGISIAGELGGMKINLATEGKWTYTYSAAVKPSPRGW